MNTRVEYRGKVERVTRQPSRRGVEYPTLVDVKLDGLPSQQYQVSPEEDVAEGLPVRLTLLVGAEAREGPGQPPTADEALQRARNNLPTERLWRAHVDAPWIVVTCRVGPDGRAPFNEFVRRMGGTWGPWVQTPEEREQEIARAKAETAKACAEVAVTWAGSPGAKSSLYDAVLNAERPEMLRAERTEGLFLDAGERFAVRETILRACGAVPYRNRREILEYLLRKCEKQAVPAHRAAEIVDAFDLDGELWSPHDYSEEAHAAYERAVAEARARREGAK